MADPLRYNISDWHQAADCLSNNSDKLHISVSDFVQNESIQGTRITVSHEVLGLVFSYVVDPTGELISDVGPVLSTESILTELSRYGFLITFNQKAYLPAAQLRFLVTLQNLKFDKIRLLTVVRPSGDTATYVVAFKIKQNPTWISNKLSITAKEFTDSVTNGSAFNVSTVSESERFRWDWLDYVADIEDILRDNT